MIILDRVDQEPSDCENDKTLRSFSFRDLGRLTKETTEVDIPKAIEQRQNILFAGPGQREVLEYVSRYAKRLREIRPEESIAIIERGSGTHAFLERELPGDSAESDLEIDDVLARIDEQSYECIVMIDAIQSDSVPLLKRWASLGGGLATLRCDRYEDVMATIGRYMAASDGVSDDAGMEDARRCIDVIIFVQSMLPIGGERALFAEPPTNRPTRDARIARATECEPVLGPDKTKMFVAYDPLIERAIACVRDDHGNGEVVGLALTAWVRDGLRIRYHDESDVGLNVPRFTGE